MEDGYTVEEAGNLIEDILIPAANELSFDFLDERDLLIAGYYTSVLENGWSALLLIRNDVGYRSYPLLRGMLLSSVQMRALIEDESRLKPLRLKYLKETRLMLSFADSGNPYFSQIAKRIDTDRHLQEICSEIEELKSEGVKVIPDEQLFQQFGESALYDGPYRMWSQHVHPNFGSITSANIRIRDQEKIEFVSFNHGEAGEFVAASTSVYEFCREASIQIHDYKLTNKSKVLRGLRPTN